MGIPCFLEAQESLTALRQHFESLRKAVEESGKRAFEVRDPATAKLEAERLEQVERAQRLLSELELILLEIDPEATKVSEVREKRRRLSGRVIATRDTSRLPFPVMYRDRLQEPVLTALRQAGGQAHIREIWARVERMMGSLFSASDLEKMRSHNESRWQYNVRWTLTYLRQEGLVEHGDRKGMWRLTPRA